MDGTPNPWQDPASGAAPDPAPGSVAERLAELPGIWELGWWMLVRPISLLRRLRGLGIYDPDAPGWRLRWRGDAIARAYAARMALSLLAATVAVAVAIGLVLMMMALDFDCMRVARHVFRGMAFGVVFGVVIGAAFGGGVSVILGVAFGVATTATYCVAFGEGFNQSVGVVNGMVGAMVGKGAVGVAWGLALGMVLRAGVGVAVGVALGLAVGLTAGVAFGVAYFRLPIYLVEIPWQLIAFATQRNTARITLAASPILHHELSYLPLPTLAEHMRITAARDPALTRRALAACAIAPGQRRAGRRALAMIRADELRSLARDRRFQSLRDLNGEWLPDPASADGTFTALQEVGRHLRAAELTLIARQRAKFLTAAADRLRGLDNALLGSRDPEAPIMRAALPDWQRLVADWLAETRAASALEVPNPFCPGVPLAPDFGREVFRGREPLVAEIESVLGDPAQGSALALIGPRRCGKTSLLSMLTLKLPDTLVVFFDAQKHPSDSTGALVAALVGQAKEQARRERRLTLPDAPPGPPMESLAAWLEALECSESVGSKVRRILFCIDEYERWEGLFPGDRRALLQLLGLLRATIQHRRRLRVLIAGAAQVDELDPMWADHLVNLRTLAIGPLPRPVTLDLLTRPSDDFPPDAIPGAVAEAVWARTLGQPYLTQLYGSLLVERLNEARRETGRRQTTVDDCAALAGEVLDKANTYLTNLVQDLEYKAPPAALAVLERLARGEPVDLSAQDRATRRYLHRRGLIGADRGLGIPVLGAFLRQVG